MSLQKHTVKSYDQDLKTLAKTIEEMANLSLKSIEMISDSITKNGENFVEKIQAHDYKINSLDFLIEKKVTSILALRQPMALDLRYIVSALKISSNLERIGDQAKSIIKKLVHASKIEKEVEKSMLEMLKISKNMVQMAVESFNDQDFKKAQKVLENDEQIDQIYRNLFGIINQKKFSNQEVENIVNILFIAKSFERLADHSTNIAEVAQYVITGETK